MGRFWAMAAGIFLLVAAASAQDDASPEPAGDREEVRDEILVTGHTNAYTVDSTRTATRLNLSLRDTPQSISVIGEQQVDDFALETVAEVMMHTPGVSVSAQDTERVRFSARGFSIDNYLYDGLPSMRTGSLAGQTAHADPVIYERIEVLRGATGLLHGIGNPSATINLVRKKPDRAFSGSTQFGVDDWDGYRGEIDVGGPLNASGSVRGRFVGAYEQTDSFLDHYESDKSMLYGVIETDLTDATLLTVGVDSLDYDPEGSTWGALPLYYSDGSITDFPVSLNPGTDWSSWAQDARTAFVNIDHGFDNGWAVRLAYTRQENGYDAKLASAGSGFPDPDTGAGMNLWVGRYVEERTQDTFDAFVNGSFPFLGREHELILGVTHSTGDRHYTGQPGLDFDTVVDDLENWDGDRAMPQWGDFNAVENEAIDQTGFYGTARFDATERLALITGVRIVSWQRSVDAVSDWAGESSERYDESGEPVPYLGVVYDLNDTYSLYASYTSIFKPQTQRNVNNEVLKPEQGLGYEAGLKSEFAEGRLNAAVALFLVRQDNFAESTGEPIMGGPPDSVAYRAVDGAETRGFEIEVAGELLPRWQIMGGYTHRVTRDPDDTKINTTAPEDLLRLSTRYQFTGELEGLSIGAGISWQDRIYTMVNRPGYVEQVRYTQPSYNLIDLMVRYRFSESLAATLNASNVLDEKYYNNLGFYNGGYYGDPRKVSLRLSWDF